MGKALHHMYFRCYSCHRNPGEDRRLRAPISQYFNSSLHTLFPTHYMFAIFALFDTDRLAADDYRSVANVIRGFGTGR